MDSKHLQLDLNEDSRYSRLEMIPWWNQDVLRRSRVIVVGAGALGNEIIKNLALLGVGNILIIDFDCIEMSNLSRSILYTSSDNDKPKAMIAANSAKAINPDCNVYALNTDVTYGVGLGTFRWADVIICGLDSREARLAVNKACWKVNKPWVDGATESFQGIARVFQPPNGVCYECTLSEQDQKLMSMRNSCGFLAKEAQHRGSTPTTPTTSAVIAGIEVQEAIKLMHKDANLPNLINKGFFFDGVSYDCFTVEYVRKDDCISHETFENIVTTELNSNTATISDVIREAGKYLDGDITIDLPSEMITELRCNSCNSTEKFFHLLDSVDMGNANCPDCNKLRVPDIVTGCNIESIFASIPIAELGFGIMDIIPARSGENEVQIEISGDSDIIFGNKQ